MGRHKRQSKTNLTQERQHVHRTPPFSTSVLIYVARNPLWLLCVPYCSVRREWDRRVESGQYVPFQLTPDFLTPPPHVISLCSLCLTRASPGLPRASYAADSVPAASRVSGGRPLGPARSPSRRRSHPLTYRWPPLLFTTAGVLPVLPLDYSFIRIKC